MKKKLSFLILSLLINNIIIAQNQNNIDSLKQCVNNEENDSIRVVRLLNLGDLYENSIPDSAIFYYNKALTYSENIENHGLIARCLNYIGIVYTSLSNYDDALVYFNKSISIYEKIGNQLGTANCYNNIGRINKDEGNYSKAIDFYLKSLKIYDKINNKIGMAQTYGNIGNVHTEQSNRKKAIEYYHKALTTFKELDHKRGMSYCYNNLGIIHEGQSDYNESIDNYKKSLEIKIQLDDKKGMASSMSNIGYVYQLKGEYNNAFRFYNKALEIDTELGLMKDVAIDNIDIAELHILFADSTKNDVIRASYINKAINFANKSLTISEEIKSMPIEKTALGLLMRAYENKGDYKNSVGYAKRFISLKDSLYSIEKTKVFTEMESKYKAEKSKLQLEKLEKQKQLDKKTIEAQQSENYKQLIIIISAIAVLILVILFSLIVLKMLRQKRRANQLLIQKGNEIVEKNEELNQQSEELKALNDNLIVQNNKIKTQRDEIEIIHFQVSESIDYATRLQESILPLKNVLSEKFPEYFVLYKPKDKVSGDFYWWADINNHTIITVSDCTGHGVPGAIMSTLGISFLREIVVKNKCIDPAEILSKLRKEIIRALKQKPDYYESNSKLGIKDGMDMSIISINNETNVMQFSGANNPIYLIKDDELKIRDDKKIKKITASDYAEISPDIAQISSSEVVFKNESSKILYELRPDKMPISIYRNMKNFSNHKFKLDKGDILYMFSDGFADQFGGPKGKKFKSKSFKKLILENVDKPMKTQKEILNKTFVEWQDKLDQIDDVTVLGIKI